MYVCNYLFIVSLKIDGLTVFTQKRLRNKHPLVIFLFTIRRPVSNEPQW